MKSGTIKKIIIFTVMAVLIISYYVHISSKTAGNVEENYEKTVVSELLSKDTDLNYPGNPRDVVVYYSEIISAFYKEKLTEDQLVGLAQHARALFDEELLELNEYNEYMQRLREEIQSYKLNDKYIAEFLIERASDVEYIVDNGVQYAEINALYYLKEGSEAKRTKTYEKYTLRKDENGNWKILFWETVPENNFRGE